MDDNQKLTKLRKEIDTIDEQIVALLNKRAKLALQARLAKNGTIHRPEREAQIMATVIEKNSGPLSNEGIQTIFQTIIMVCRSIQEVDIKEGS